MTVDNEMAIKLHEYYMNHKNMWLKIADILRTDRDAFDKLVSIKINKNNSAFYATDWLKRKALKSIKSGVYNNINSHCFCCQANRELDNLCGSRCIVIWSTFGGCLLPDSLYDDFNYHIQYLGSSTSIEKLARIAENIANLPFRYQEEYEEAIKQEGENK